MRGWRVALSLLLAVGLLLLFFRGVDWNAMGRALRAADPIYLCGVVLVTLVTYAARAWRWGFLLAPLARVPFGRLFSATFVGFMTGLLIPRAQEVVRPYLVARRHPVSIPGGVRVHRAGAAHGRDHGAAAVRALPLRAAHPGRTDPRAAASRP